MRQSLSTHESSVIVDYWCKNKPSSLAGLKTRASAEHILNHELCRIVSRPSYCKMSDKSFKRRVKRRSRTRKIKRD